jgi:hypothetical protein
MRSEQLNRPKGWTGTAMDRGEFVAKGKMEIGTNLEELLSHPPEDQPIERIVEIPDPEV